MRPPNTASFRSSDPTFSFCALTTSICMMTSIGGPEGPPLLLALLLHRLDLSDLDLLGRHCLADHEDAVRTARHRTLDEQQVVVGIDLQHLEVAHRHAVGAHVPGH